MDNGGTKGNIYFVIKRVFCDFKPVIWMPWDFTLNECIIECFGVDYNDVQPSNKSSNDKAAC